MLEEFEESVMDEFGSGVRVHGALGKAVGFLTKEGRAQRAMQKEIQADWVGRIRRSWGRSSSPYVYGYAEYLCAFVYMGTDDIKKAIKSFEDALRSGFDNGLVLSFLFYIHDQLKHKTEAAQWAQKALDYCSVESEKEAEENDFEHQLVLAIKSVGQEPQFVQRIWQSILDQNSQKSTEIIKALEPNIEAARKENVVSRTKMGIEILDQLISVAQTDKILSEGKTPNGTMIDSRSAELLDLSLEEIELFKNSGTDKLVAFYSSQIPLQAALEYLEDLVKNKFGDIAANIEECIKTFPNMMATIQTVKKFVAQFIEQDQQDSALILAEYAIEKRASTKTPALYDAICPLQKSLHEKHQWIDEIALISKSRKILQEEEFSKATSDLTEAYLAALNEEQSLSQKDKLLKEAESESLSDDRLRSLRAEVNSLLARRKKILTWTAITIGAVILVAILIVNLLK